MTKSKSEIQTLYEIIYDYLDNSQIQLSELLYMFEQIKFEQMQEVQKKLDEENLSEDGN